MPSNRVLKFQLCDVTGFHLETRRVLAPEEETFEALSASVETLFGLDLAEYELVWTDEEGDDVIVRSTDEFAAARLVSLVTTFQVRLKINKIRSKSEANNFERRRFGDKIIVDGVLICDDGTHAKGRWLAPDRFVAHFDPDNSTRVPGQMPVAAGTMLALFDYFGARTAFIVPGTDMDDSKLANFEDWHRREAWTWSDDRKKKHPRPLPQTKHHAPSPGSIVILGGLKSEGFNGARGIVAANRTDGRSLVELFAPLGGVIAVKPENLKHVASEFEESTYYEALEQLVAQATLEDNKGREGLLPEDLLLPEGLLGMSQSIPLCCEGITIAYFTPEF